MSITATSEAPSIVANSEGWAPTGLIEKLAEISPVSMSGANDAETARIDRTLKATIFNQLQSARLADEMSRCLGPAQL